MLIIMGRAGDDMDALGREKSYTVEDIYALPDGKRAELIDGEIYSMSPPNTTHQRIVSKLHFKIAGYMEKNGGLCEVFLSPFAVFLNKDNKNYLEPDISVICDKHKIDETGCNGAPDWVIEVVSKSSRRMDYYFKLFKYQNAGVREYWIVDPEKKAVTVYSFEKETMEQYAFEDAVPVGIYEDFSITLA